MALLSDTALVIAVQVEQPTITWPSGYDFPTLIAAPSTPTLTAVSGTSNGAEVEALVTFVTPGGGETLPSAVTALSPSANQQAKVSSPTIPLASVSGYNVYAGAVGGPHYLQNGTTAVAGGTDYTIPGTLVTGTAQPPTVATATTIAGWVKMKLLSDGMMIWRPIASQAVFAALAIGTQSTVDFN